MSNSSLVTFTKISPNRTVMSNKKNTHIVIHHMAGNLTVEACGNSFASTSRKASSNYGIDGKGHVGLYVEEKDRAWTTGSREIDSKAITIEVANDGGAPDWHVSDTALNKLIELCTDICKRNGIAKLNYTGDKSGNLHMHRWYQNTNCPGPYLGSKFKYIADEVNKRLAGGGQPTPEPSPEPTPAPSGGFKEGDIVILKPDATYYDGKAIPSWVKKSTLYYRGTNVNGVIISTQKTGAITGVVKPEAIANWPSDEPTPAPAPKFPYKVKIDVKSLNVRKGPSTNYPVTTVVKQGEVYTIVGEDNGWGKLKSGAGYIYLEYTKRV